MQAIRTDGPRDHCVTGNFLQPLPRGDGNDTEIRKPFQLVGLKAHGIEKTAIVGNFLIGVLDDPRQASQSRRL
jgi:hypothetical protein